MFDDTWRYTVVVIDVLEVCVPENANSLVIHVCRELAARFATFDAMEKVPYVQNNVDKSLVTPVMKLFANVVHVIVERLVAFRSGPVVVMSTSVAYVVFVTSRGELFFIRSCHSKRHRTSIGVLVRFTNFRPRPNQLQDGG